MDKAPDQLLADLGQASSPAKGGKTCWPHFLHLWNAEAETQKGPETKTLQPKKEMAQK